MNELVENSSRDGEITYMGKEITNINSIYLRTRVGMVFKQPNPFPMSIKDNIFYGPRCQGVRNKKTLNEILES